MASEQDRLEAWNEAHAEEAAYYDQEEERAAVGDPERVEQGFTVSLEMGYERLLAMTEQIFRDEVYDHDTDSPVAGLRTACVGYKNTLEALRSHRELVRRLVKAAKPALALLQKVKRVHDLERALDRSVQSGTQGVDPAQIRRLQFEVQRDIGHLYVDDESVEDGLAAALAALAGGAE